MKLMPIAVFLSMMAITLPAKSATLGLLPMGLAPADNYDQVYAATSLLDVDFTPLDDGRAAISQLTNVSNRPLDIPWEDTLAAVEDEPFALQHIFAQLAERAAAFSTQIEADRSPSFDLEIEQLAPLIGYAEASTLQVSKGGKRCNQKRNQRSGGRRGQPLSAQQVESRIARQAECWSR